MRGQLQRFERVDVQGAVHATCQFAADPGDDSEKLLGIERAPQAIELTPAAGRQHLADGFRDPRADRRKPLQPLGPLALENVAEIVGETGDAVAGVPVGANAERVRFLLLEDIGRFSQPVCDELVRGATKA